MDTTAPTGDVAGAAGAAAVGAVAAGDAGGGVRIGRVVAGEDIGRELIQLNVPLRAFFARRRPWKSRPGTGHVK